MDESNTNGATSFSLSSLMYISNPFKDDFIAKWNGAEYLLPSNKMTPVVVGTPEQNQEIRKVWALKLCERELARDKKFSKQIYTKIDLDPLMAKCLAPLEKVELASKPAKKTQRELERIANIEGTFQPEAAVAGAVNGSAPSLPAFN